MRKPRGYDQRLFRFLSEQQTAKIGQLARAFGVYRADMERFVAEFEAQGLVESKRFVTGDDVWVWLTPPGARMAGTGFKATVPHYRTLAHLGAITDARLYAERNFGDVTWLSERFLRREQGGQPQGYLPDAVVLHSVKVDGKRTLRRYAIEVELSLKQGEHLDEKISANEKKHDLVIYFAAPGVYRRFKSLRLEECHSNLRLRGIPGPKRQLGHPAWRIPGDPKPRRRPRVNLQAVELFDLEFEILDFVNEQGAVPLDQLCSFFDLEVEEAKFVLSRLVQTRLLERAKPLVDEPPWHWASHFGAKLTRKGLPPMHPALNGLERVRVVNEVRQRLTKDNPGVEWVSGRVLHRDRTRPGKAPDGAVKIGDEVHAIDVLLFAGDRRRLEDRIARRFEEGYDAALWFYSSKSSWTVKKFHEELTRKYRGRLRIMPVPAVEHVALAPGTAPKMNRDACSSVPYSDPHLWSRLASRRPARLRMMPIEAVREDALETIARAAGVERKPTVIEAWLQLPSSSGVRWIVTDLGFFRVSHSGRGNRADEVAREDLFVKEDGPPIDPRSPAERSAAPRVPPKPEEYQLSDEAWDLVKPLIPVVKAMPLPSGRIVKLPVEDRAVLSGLIWKLRNRTNWVSIPLALHYGSGATIQARLRRWEELDVWDDVRGLLEAELPDGGDLEWWRLETLETMRERGRPHPTAWPRLKAGVASGEEMKKMRAFAEPERFEIEADLWRQIERELARVEAHREQSRDRERASDRMALSAAVWRLRHEVGWQSLPYSLGYGSWKVARRRLRELEALGIWDDVRMILERGLPDGDKLAWWRLGPLATRRSPEQPAAARRRAAQHGQMQRGHPNRKPLSEFVEPKRYEVGEQVWKRVEAILTSVEGRQGARPAHWISDRASLSGILWRLRHGEGWQSIPKSLGYGTGDSVRQRLREWEALEVWEEIRKILEAELPDGGALDWDCIKPVYEPERERFNHRQSAWLAHMQNEPGLEFRYADYERFHGVGRKPAQRDLVALAEQWLIVGAKPGTGAGFTFVAAPDFEARLQELERDRSGACGGS